MASSGSARTAGPAISIRPSGYTSGSQACTQSGSEGRYTLTGVGPYDWPILFTHFYDDLYNYVPVWSGGAVDRRSATPVRTRVGAPGVGDGTIGSDGGGILTGALHETNGDTYNGHHTLELYNNRTGDLVKEYSGYGSKFTVPGVADQVVRIRYYALYPRPATWYGGHDFHSADPVRIHAGQTTTLDLTLPPEPAS
jgi:hypothetical protein